MLFSTVENVDVRYFVDTANLWGVDYSDDVDQSNTIRASTGFCNRLVHSDWSIKFFSIARSI